MRLPHRHARTTTKRLSLVALGTLIATISFLPKVAVAYERTIADDVFYIKTIGDTSLGLDNAGGSTDVGANVQLGAIGANAGTEVQWRLVYDSGGWYKIQNVAGGTYLQSRDGNTSNGANVDLYTWNSEINQEWAIVRNNDVWSFVHRKSGLLLDVERASYAAGVNIDLWQQNLQLNQEWKLTSVTPFYDAASVEVSGDAYVGGTLTANVSVPLGSRPTYSWLKSSGNFDSGTPIPGEAGSTYVLRPSDLGKRIYCVVSDSSGIWMSPISIENYAGGAYSSRTDPVRQGQLVGSVSIEGECRVGSTIVAATEGMPEGSTPRYTWVRPDGTVVGTGDAYVIGEGDYPSALTCRVTDGSGVFAGTLSAQTSNVSTQGLDPGLSVTPAEISFVRPQTAQAKIERQTDGALCVDPETLPPGLSVSLDDAADSLALDASAERTATITIRSAETARYAAGEATLHVVATNPNINVTIPTTVLFSVDEGGSASPSETSIGNQTPLPVRITSIDVSSYLDGESMTCVDGSPSNVLYVGSGRQQVPSGQGIVPAQGSLSLSWAFTNGISSKQTLTRLSTLPTSWGTISYTIEIAG